MDKAALLKKLEAVEQYAAKSKWQRLYSSPTRYLYGIVYRELFYKSGSAGKLKQVQTFWGHTLRVALPASMDIFLSGGKTHDSEIRLARFLINQIGEYDIFLDIGAHIGYFTLLAAHLASKGEVHAIEASPETFSILEKNTCQQKNVRIYHLAFSDSNGELEFQQFPVLYSEFNTMEGGQYLNEKWYAANKPRVVKVNCTSGSRFLLEKKIKPTMIKIDVEGAEERVITGLSEYLKGKDCTLIMEFATNSRNNKPHIRAEEILMSLGFQAHRIHNDGGLRRLEMATQQYVTQNFEESDNIVYLKGAN